MPTLSGGTWPNNRRGLDLPSLAVIIADGDLSGLRDDRFRLCDGCWGCSFGWLSGGRSRAGVAVAGNALKLCNSVLDAHGLVFGSHMI